MPTPEKAPVTRTPNAATREWLYCLFECGRTEFTEPGTLFERESGAFVFAVVTAGEGKLRRESRLFALREGDCLFLDCLTPTRFSPDDFGTLELLYARFGGCASAAYYHYYLMEHYPIRFHPARVEPYRDLLYELYFTNCGPPNRPNEMQNSCLLTRLLTMLCAPPDPKAEQNPRLRAKLRAVIIYLDTHYTEDLSLDAVAERFDISRSYLSREFKREFHESIVDHVTRLRMEYAKKLLRTTDTSVREISELCGYHDQCYFIQVFKKTQGTTCGQYRELWRGKNRP